MAYKIRKKKGKYYNFHSKMRSLNHFLDEIYIKYTIPLQDKSDHGAYQVPFLLLCELSGLIEKHCGMVSCCFSTVYGSVLPLVDLLLLNAFPKVIYGTKYNRLGWNLNSA